MKLDMDLVREILLATEASEENPMAWIKLEIPDRTVQEISYQVVLLDEAGLIIAQDLCHMGSDGYDWKPKRLTWNGHQLLNDIRDPEVWKKTKIGADEIGSIGIDVISALAKGLIKEKVKKHTGIDINI